MSLDEAATTVVHYTIAKRSRMEAALVNGGVGILEQGGKWHAAGVNLEAARQDGEDLLLLVADAAETNRGSEWLAILDRLEPSKSGRTLIHFSGLRVLPNPVPKGMLIKLSDGEPINYGYRHGNVACKVAPKWLARPRTVIRGKRQTEPAQNIGTMGAAAQVAADPLCASISETTRAALINARLGQGSYRAALLQFWDGRCALTGCRIQEALIASHAKPWALCSNKERLDPYNGLLLAASIDRLFDRGLIAFGDDGSLLRRPSLEVSELARLGVQPGQKLSAVHAKNLPYLRAHRAQFGFKP